MSHTHAQKDDLLKRVRRIQGQMQAVERALESGAECAKTLHLVAATRGAINGLMGKSSRPMPWSMWPILNSAMPNGPRA